MKPFHYNQDPLYAAAASILTGQQLIETESLEEAVKANDPKNLRMVISNHTALLNKATDSKAKEFHRVAIANAKEKLKALGETVEEAKNNLKSLSLAQLKSQLASLDNQIGRLEDKQGFAPEELKAEFRAIDAEIQLRKGMKEDITEDMGISWELIRSMYVKDLVDVVLGLAIGGGAALAGMATLKIKKFIDDKKEDMQAAKEANLVKSALDKIKKDKEASSLLAAIKTAKDNKETKELKSQYRARLNTLLSDDELGMLSGVYSTSLKEGDEGFYSQKMIKNQLQTIVRNSNTCLEMIGAGREFPEWAQSEIAVAEDGIVSVTEFMQSHKTGEVSEDINEKLSASSTAKEWIDDFIKSDNPKFDGKTKEERINMALGAYYAAQKNEAAMSEAYTIKTSGARVAMEKFTMLDAVELEDFLKAASMYFAEEGESEGAFTNLAELFGKAAKAWSNR